MRALVLWANEQTTNLGVRALARGSGDLIQAIWPGAKVTFANYGDRPAELPWGRPRSLVRERVTGRLGMMNWLEQFDLVWDTRSGDSFADIYGMHRHLTMSLVHEFAQQAGVPIALAPQTIGPFNTQRGRALARRNLKRSRFVFSRDPQSTQVAKQLGRTPELTTADMVFAIKQPSKGPDRDVLFNVSGLLWESNPHVNSQNYRRVVIDSVRRLRAAGRSVTLLAHVLDSPNPDNDMPAIRAVEGEIGEELEVVVPTSLDSVRESIAGARVLVGSRMHACLNALSVGVPAVPLAYSRKFAPLLDSVGWTTGFDLRTDDTEALPERVVEAAAVVTQADARNAARAGAASLEPIVELMRAVS